LALPKTDDRATTKALKVRLSAITALLLSS